LDKPVTPVSILLVEDNPHDVEITERAMAKARIKNKLRVARDGQEAIDLLTAETDPTRLPGLILLDLNLPKLCGHDVLKALRAHPVLQRIPVIALTASNRKEDVTRAYDLGVNTFITKPVEFEDFLKVIISLKEYWLHIATLPPYNGS